MSIALHKALDYFLVMIPEFNKNRTTASAVGPLQRLTTKYSDRK